MQEESTAYIQTIGEPCNECEICKAMLEGSLTDVVEMDAASNNSVEDIRSIKEKINFLPTIAKYRVYIIDEVHMLSTGAFNALLKTLEEPPEHVKFILATTEPQKLPATILSRCQRFDFKRISEEDMIGRLKIVCKESKIQVAEGALELIATLSEGAARDALSILERCLQDGKTNIDEDSIKELVGIPKFVFVHNIIKAILEKDVTAAIKVIEEVLEEGKDLENFLWEMIKHAKDLLLFQVSKTMQIYQEEEKKQIEELAKTVEKEAIIHLIYELSELENKMKLSSQKTIIFETGIIKMCHQIQTVGIEERIEKLEKMIASGNRVVAIQKKEEKPKDIAAKKIPKEEKQVEEKKIEEAIKEEKETKASTTTKEDKIENWQNVLEHLKKQGKVMLYANLINTDAVQTDDMTVTIKFYNGLNAFRKGLFEQSENQNLLNKEIAMMCGKAMRVKLEDAKGKENQVGQEKSKAKKETKKSEENQEETLEDLGIDINFVEE